MIQGKSEHAAIDAPEALEKCKGVSAHCKTLLPITKIKLRPLEFTPLEIDTVVPRQFVHSVNGTPRKSGNGFSGTQPRESNGQKLKKRIKN